jgi:hypothetical protein
MKSTINSGLGYTYTSGAGGFSLNLDRAGGKKRPPLTVYLHNEAGATYARVQAGTLNGMIPKISGAYIDNYPLPKIALSSAGVIVLKVTRADATPFPATAVITFETEKPADTYTNGYITLASITKSGDAYGVENYISANLICYRIRVADQAAHYYWDII